MCLLSPPQKECEWIDWNTQTHTVQWIDFPGTNESGDWFMKTNGYMYGRQPQRYFIQEIISLCEMALDVTYKEGENLGAVVARFFDVTITGYNSSGESLTPADVGLNRIQHVSATPANGDTFSVGYNSDTDTLHLDIADGEDTEIQLMVYGR
jgi:hypothetical protein